MKMADATKTGIGIRTRGRTSGAIKIWQTIPIAAAGAREHLRKKEFYRIIEAPIRHRNN
jgi:hypothetical protein